MDLLPTLTAFVASSDNTSEFAISLASAEYEQDGALFHGYSAGLLTFASIVCYIFMMVGIPGNLITIIALARCKKVRNATAAFIINLSLSDLLFCCFNLPLAASTLWHRDWVHSQLLCRLWPLLRYGLLAVSLFTVLAITINRYIMIGHPRIYPRIYRRKYLGFMVACTWLLAFCALIPTWRGVWGTFGLDPAIGSCSILKDKNGNSPKEFLFIMAFALPCMFIVICYARIFYIVRRTAMRSRDPVLKPGISTRTIDNDRPANNSSEDRQQFTAVDVPQQPPNCDNNHHHQQRLGHDQDVDPDEVVVIRTTSEKPRCPLTKFKDDDLKFIDTSLESDNNNYLIRNMTTNGGTGRDVEVDVDDKSRSEDMATDDENEVGILANGVSDSAMEDDKEESIGDAKMMNGSQYLSVLVEPSSSSGIDVALDQDEPVQPINKRRKYIGSLKRSIRHGRRQDRNNNSNATARKHSTMNNNTSASAIYPGKMTTKDRRLLKMILVIFISFLMCYLPITITKIFSAVSNIHSFHIMSYLLIYLTTCINPIIYVVMSSEYRQAYWNLLLCRVNNWNRREAAKAARNHHHRVGSVKT